MNQTVRQSNFEETCSKLLAVPQTLWLIFQISLPESLWCFSIGKENIRMIRKNFECIKVRFEKDFK